MKKLLFVLNILLLIFGLATIGIAIYYAIKWIPQQYESILYLSDKISHVGLQQQVKTLVIMCIHVSICFFSSIVMITLFIILSPTLFRKSTYKNFVDNLSSEWKKNKEERKILKKQAELAKKRELLQKLQEEIDSIDSDNN